MQSIAEVNTSETTVYQVKVGQRVIGEASSRVGAELLISRLDESERSMAVIVPVAGHKEILLG